MANKAVLTIEVLVDAAKASAGLDQASSKAGKFSAGVSKAALPAAAGLAALGAAAFSSAEAAAEDAKSQAILAKALKNSTGASDAGVAQTEEWISQTSKAAAVADDVLRPALATLARATGDVEQSQQAMALALDISAATGKDVEAVSAALAKGYGGNTAALGRLVPGMDKAILATKDMEKITAELARTTGGSAAEAAKSAAGQVEGMKIQFGEAQESLGAALLPALSKGATLLANFAMWTQRNTKLLLIITGVLATLAAGILVVNTALKVYNTIQAVMAINAKRAAAGQLALNAAMLANPVGLVVVAVVALVAAIVLLWKKCEGFRTVVTAVWKAAAAGAVAAWRIIRTAVSTVLTAIRGYLNAFKTAATGVWNAIQLVASLAWKGIRLYVQAVFTALKLYITAYKTVVILIWRAIEAAARVAWNGIKAIVQGVIRVISSISSTLNSLVNGSAWASLKRKAGDIFGAVLTPINAVRTAIDKVIEAVRTLIDWLGKIKVPKISLPKIPGLSSGPTAAPSGLVAGPRAVASTTASSSGAGTVVNVYGALDPVAVARQVRQILASDERRRRGVHIGAGRGVVIGGTS